MRAKVLKAVADFSMLNKGDRVLVALSGGADSVALLNILNSFKEEYNLTLYACHLNHEIRGEQADFDEAFAKNVCENLGVQCFVKHVDVPKMASDLKCSLELCGRIARYEFFAELAEKLSCKVATGHTASDNVETVLYNIARGTGLNGLCGIKATRDNYVRPLIYCSREDVERYCSDNDLSFVTDSTNLEDDYTRNKIRHNAVPTLRSINSELCDSVATMCSTVSDVADFLNECSKKELNESKTEHGYSCEKLLKLHKALLTNTLFMIAKAEGAELNSTHCALVIESMRNGGCVDLPNGMRAVCKQGVLRFVSTDETCDTFECKLSEYKNVRYISQEEIKNINKNLLNDYISCDIINDSTVVRERAQGDMFTLYHRNVTKSLKKLLNELKIPSEKRSNLKVVANGNTVLWLQGVGTSKQGRVNEQSNGAVRILEDNDD